MFFFERRAGMQSTVILWVVCTIGKQLNTALSSPYAANSCKNY